ncbi:hypothetical protein MADA3029_80046 [Vibrio nigripulchritudo MADA3029]|nr:hypothetical protein VIBNIMADA3020_1130047 [Vibrio nigripulchritudo MADA3020]CCN52579.1 hypothetical protein VIBNIMADA3021_1290003 [Vibrio nigripulchritudo MADA3021]CCN61498.1 hypothetical protein MADA3029_80046 [Vibrio nigripulchritudo MADA3029]
MPIIDKVMGIKFLAERNFRKVKYLSTASRIITLPEECQSHFDTKNLI